MPISQPKHSWKPLLITLHYLNFLTDLLTLWNLSQFGDTFYFKFLLTFVLFTFLLRGALFVCVCRDRNPILKSILFWLLQIDYAHSVTSYGGSGEGGGTLTSSLPKMIYLLCETVPSIFITLDSIFNAEIVHIIPWASVFFSLLDFSFSNSAILYCWTNGFQNFTAPELDAKMISTLFKATMFSMIENTMVVVGWGFFVKLLYPRGVWFFFSVFFCGVVYIVGGYSDQIP